MTLQMHTGFCVKNEVGFYIRQTGRGEESLSQRRGDMLILIEIFKYKIER